MTSRREAATLIIGALMLFGAAAMVSEAEERAQARSTASAGASIQVMRDADTAMSHCSVHHALHP